MAPEPRTDKQLIDAYLRGDQDAFTELYERYRRPLFRYLNQMMPGQTATVDDLFQKTWLKVVDGLGRYQDRQTFFAWLVRIGRNNAIDHFRQAAQRENVEIDETRLATDRPIPWRQLNSRELARAIEQAVGTLPPEQKEVFLMRQQDVPFKDIAEIQDCPLNTVLGRMHYAVTRLREILKDWR
jgi:RNA polymerase sigma-70 factor, ECF subfamily